MTRRARVILASAALLVGGGAGLLAGAVLLVTETGWGHARLRAYIERAAAAAIAPGARVTIGSLDGGLGRAWTVDSITVSDATGTPVFGAARISIDAELPAMLRNVVHVRLLTIQGAYARITQDGRGGWNAASLAPPASAPAPSHNARAAWRVIVDSIDSSDGRVDLTTPGAAPGRSPVRRHITGLRLAMSGTTIETTMDAAGHTTLRALAFVVDSPAVAVQSASGTFGWWRDSLRMDVPALRLPRSVASVRGSVAWNRPGTPRMAMDIRADTINLRDVHQIAALVPSDGIVSARGSVRSTTDGAIEADLTGFDLRTGGSHVAGAFRFISGKRPQIRNVSVSLEPLDLTEVRAMVGDSALPVAWRGSISGTLAASGGPLDSLVIESIDLTYDDARAGGVKSRAVLAGAVDAARAPARFLGLRLAINPLAVRTLGAAVPAADAIAGIVHGHVTLDGTLDELRLTDLYLAHSDSHGTSLAISGDARVAPAREGRWLDARLALDTVSIADLTRGRSPMQLQGSLHGTVGLHADRDTLAVAATIAERGGATIAVNGTALLDSTLAADLVARVRGLDPGAFIARRDIPATYLTGAATISIAGRGASQVRRLTLTLDSTSTIGDSRIAGAAALSDFGPAGLRVDTADVRTASWRVSARGQLTADSSRTDTLRFGVAVDSLSALRSILLDSTGAPRFADMNGSVRIDSGRVAGSFRNARLTGRFAARDLRVNGDTIAAAEGTVDIGQLPARASGTVRLLATDIRSGPASMDTMTVSATVIDGQRARFSIGASLRDSVGVTAAGDVAWPAGGYEGRVDSLAVALGSGRWWLGAPAAFAMRAGTFTLDSAAVRSNRGATAHLAAEIPDSGQLRGRLRVGRLGFEELGFTGAIPADVAGLVTAAADLSGTRDAPVVRATIAVDSVRIDDIARPPLAATLDYSDRIAHVRLSVGPAERAMLDARGDIPLDLTLRGVATRIPDSPASIRFRASGLSLAAFDGVIPRLRDLSGSLDANIEVAGTLRNPRGSGELTLADASFDLPRLGFSARRGAARLQLAGDSVIVRQLRLSDGDSPRDTAAVTGVVHLTGREWSDWVADLRSRASSFRVMDDPRVATVKADWNLAISGALREPRVTGNVLLPYGVFTIGPRRRAIVAASDSAGAPTGTPNADGVVVALGSDVRLRSREANVQLAGSVELFGSLNRPWISGSVLATRGTYRVDVGPLSRTFRVDSGAVILEGTTDVPPALDIRASYIVKQPNADDVKIGAHLYGTTDRPRLDLSSDLGSATSQSEIISYLVFGKPSFAVPEGKEAAAQTAYEAVVPSILGGYLESLLSTVLPFFNTLQVTAVGRDDPRFSISNPIENLLNSFAVTGGRQIGTDSFLTLTTGVCTGSSVSTTNASPIWFGTSAEYRPKRTIGAAVSIDPGPAPCSRVVAAGDAYQLGFDLLYDWRFGRRPPVSASRPSPP